MSHATRMDAMMNRQPNRVTLPWCGAALLAGLLLSQALASGVAATEVYKWVDEQGITHYSQHPPAANQAQRLKMPPSPPASPEKTREELGSRLRELEKAREQKSRDAKRREAEALQAAQRKHNCQAAKNNLTQLQSSPRKRVRDRDGNFVRLTEEQRQGKILEAQKQVRDHCH